MSVILALLLAAWSGGDTVPARPPVSIVPPPIVQVSPPPPPPPAPPANAGDIAVRPKLVNMLEIFNTPNYPYWAMAMNEEGRVQFVADVNAAGMVTACRVTQSSGFPNLDLGTCDIVSSQGRFEPARDRNGRPIASDYRRTVVWQLMQREPWPVADSRQRIIFAVDDHKQVTECRVEMDPVDEFDPRTCTQTRGMAQVMVFASPPEFDWKDWTIVLEDSQFLDAAEAMTVGVGPGMQLFDRDITRITLDGAGKITRCETIEKPRQPMPGKAEWCARMMNNTAFAPGNGAVRELTGVDAIYMQKKEQPSTKSTAK